MFSPCLKSAAASSFLRTIAAHMQLRFSRLFGRRFVPQANPEPLTGRSQKMPLLEIVQTRQITASIRLDESTAEQIDQYAAFLHASADEVVDKALAYVFAKDRDFQEFLRTPDAARATQSLRIRRAPQNGAVAESVLQRAKPARVVETASESRSRS